MATGELIGAAGLASGWMLLWAAAAAIPVVLHFLNQRRQVTVHWAAMQLLLQVVERESRRIRVEQLALLLLRTLILLTLALAIARPYFNNRQLDESATTGAVPRLWVIAIDVSYSMGYRHDGVSRLQLAKERAQELVESGNPGDAYALVTLSEPARAIIGRPTFDKEDTLYEIRRVAQLDSGANLSSGLQVVEDMVRDAAQTQGLPQDFRVVILSDLGSDSWQSAVDGPNTEVLKRIAAKTTLEIESFSQSQPSNLAITSIEPSTTRAIAGNSLNVHVVVENFSPVEVKQLPVQVAIDGQTVQSEFVDIPANESRVVRATAVPTVPGVSVLSATIPPDRLAADNVRNHIIEVREQYRVLFVEDQPGDAEMLKLSLRPIRQPVAPRQRMSTISSIDLASTDLSNWDAIILCDLVRIDAGSYAQLVRFVQLGGALVTTFGPKTRGKDWNNLGEQFQSLLGFRFQNPSEEREWAIDPLEYRSPIVVPFAGFPDAGLLTTPVFRFWMIQVPENGELIVDLATTDGDPLIVRNPLGAGWVASILSAPESGFRNLQATQNWNAIATWPSFVPLVQQLVQTVMNVNVDNYNLLAGQPLLGTVSETAGRAQVTIVKPDGSESLITTEEMNADGTLPWVYLQTHQRGIYSAQGSTGEVQPYAVNVSSNESSLDSISPAQLQKQLPSSQPVLAVSENVADRVEGGDQLARGLLCALIVLLVAESMLAWAIGKRVG